MAIIGISGKKRTGKDVVGRIIQWLIFQETIKGTSVKDFDNFQEWVDFHDQYKDKTSHHSSWEIIKFADKLKDIVCLLIGCTREQLEDEKFKNTELGEEWDRYFLEYTKIESKQEYSTEKVYYSKYIDSIKEGAEIIRQDKHIIKDSITIIKLTPRLLLQLIGTQCFRNIIHENTWVNATMADYKKVFTSIELEDDQEFLDKLYPKWICTDVRFENEIKAIKDRGGIVIRIERPSVKSDDKHISETALDSCTEFDYTLFNNGSLEDLIKTVKEILIIEKII